MPLQLLNLGVIIPRFIYLAFITRSPRGTSRPATRLWGREAHALARSLPQSLAPHHSTRSDLITLGDLHRHIVLPRLRGAECAADGQLWAGVPAVDPHLRHHDPVLGHPAAHPLLWRALLWHRIRGVQVQAPLQCVLHAFSYSPMLTRLQSSTSPTSRRGRRGRSRSCG